MSNSFKLNTSDGGWVLNERGRLGAEVCYHGGLPVLPIRGRLHGIPGWLFQSGVGVIMMGLLAFLMALGGA